MPRRHTLLSTNECRQRRHAENVLLNIDVDEQERALQKVVSCLFRFSRRSTLLVLPDRTHFSPRWQTSHRCCSSRSTASDAQYSKRLSTRSRAAPVLNTSRRVYADLPWPSTTRRAKRCPSGSSTKHIRAGTSLMYTKLGGIYLSRSTKRGARVHRRRRRRRVRVHSASST